MRVADLLGAALEQSTKKRYGGAVAKLARFLHAAGLRKGEVPIGMETGRACPRVLGALVTSDVVMAGFLAYQANGKYAHGTASGDVSALRSLAVGPGVPHLPPISKYLNRILAGYKKLFPPGKGAAPLPQATWQAMVGLLHEVTALQGSTEEEVQAGVMPTALLTIAFSACLRSGEYTGRALRWSDVALSKEAKILQEELAIGKCSAQGGGAWVRASGKAMRWKGVAVRLRLQHTMASPTQPVDVLLFPSEDDQRPCPVSALLAHAHAVGAKPGHRDSNEPVFAVKSAKGVVRAVDRKWVASRLKGWAKLVGVQPRLLKRLKPHSLRKGGATAASLGGATEEEIKALGRWKSDAVRVYVHSAQAKMKVAQKALLAAGMGKRKRVGA